MNDQMRTVTTHVGRLVAGRAVFVGVCIAAGLLLGAVRVLLGGVPASAHSEVLIGQPLTVQSLVATNPGTVDQTRLVDAQSRILGSDEMARAVARQLPKGSADFDASISTSNNSNVLGITVTSSDAGVAKAAANQYARSYVQMVERSNLAVVDGASSRLHRQLASLSGQDVSVQAQRLALQNRLSQVELARAVDPAGGARVVDRATDASRSTFLEAATVLLGGLLGFGIALLVLTIDRWYGARRRQDGDWDDTPLFDGPDDDPEATSADDRELESSASR